MPSFADVQTIMDTPDAGPSTGYTPVIDVGGSRNATIGDPGSQLAPTTLSPATPPKPPPDRDLGILMGVPTTKTGAPLSLPQTSGGGDPTVAAKMALAAEGAKGPVAMPQDPDYPVQPGQTTGYGANIAAGAAQIPAQGIDIATDPFGNMVGKPLATGLVALHDFIAPKLGYQKFPADVRHTLLDDTVPQPGDRLVSSAAHTLGLPAPEDVVPGSAGQGMARAATTAAGLFPIMGGAGLRQAAGPAAVGATSAVAGQIAEDVAPDEYKDLANMITQSAVGAGVHVASAPVKAVTGAAVDRVNQSLEGTKVNLFGLGAGPMKPVIDPTTGAPIMKPPSFNPDTGLWEPSTEPIMARRGNMRVVGKTLADRSNMSPAELAASVPVGPAGGNPTPAIPGDTATLGQTTGNLRTLGYERTLRNTPEGRAAFTQEEARGNKARKDYLAATKPDVGDETARDHLKAVLQQHQTDVENADAASKAATTSALDKAGIRGGLPTREALGNTQRTALEDIRQPVKDEAGEALDAIDPDGTLAVRTNAPAMAQHILDNEMGPGAVTHKAERPLLNAVAQMDEVQPFSQLRLLMRNVGDAMRQIANNPKMGRESSSYRRMAMLMGSIQDSLSDAASRGGNPIYHGSNLTEFSVNDAADLRAANAAYAQYKDRFRTGAVGDVLASGPRSGTYRLSDANVPGRLFRPGQAGVDSINSLIKAAGSPAEAVRILGDAPALSLRDAAVVDGQFNEAAYTKWMKDHGDALDKLPGLRNRFANAAKGQQAAEDAAAAARQKLEDYQDSAARFYLGKDEAGAHPLTAIARLMSNENPAAAAADLMRRAGGSQAAIDGIQRNVVAWIENGARTTAELGTSMDTELSNASIQKKMADPKIKGALEAILTDDQRGRLKNLTDSLQKAARGANAVKVPGSPTTAADLAALNKGEGLSNLATAFLGDKLGGLAAQVIGTSGPLAATISTLSALGGYLVKSGHFSGLKDIHSLAIESVLNPALGRVMAQTAVKNPNAPILKQIGQRIATTLPGTVIGTLAQPREQAPASTYKRENVPAYSP
jgi:hypothetical protein